MDDPDVPHSIREDGMWDHWCVWNIQPDVRIVNEGCEPEGVLGKNTSGTLGYTRPCPPDREHRYIFRLYALDKMIDLVEGASKKEVESAIEGHILEKAVLIGRYQRI